MSDHAILTGTIAVAAFGYLAAWRERCRAFRLSTKLVVANAHIAGLLEVQRIELSRSKVEA